MSRKPIDYRRLARYQRWLQYGVLGLLLAYMFVLFMAYTIPSGVGGFFAAFAIGQVIYWGILIGSGVVVILLMKAQRRHPLTIVLLSIALLLPLINILVVLSVNSYSTRLLKAKGLRVGLLGAPSIEEFKLLPGHCRACGYDLEGLGPSVPCPECGHVPEVR